eukprot:s2712_g1.t1
MALRYRQSPHWGADLASDGGEDEFRDFLSLFEPKLKAKKCIVEFVGPSQTVGNRVLLRWRRSVSYSGAYAWVSDVVQKKFSWRLVDPDDVTRDIPPQVSTPARHLLHKALLTIRQTGKKRSSDYIAADVVLGQGTFSQVLAARPKTGGQMVAVKKYKKTSDIALQLQEVHFLQFLASDYVIPLLDVTGGDLPGSLSLVFPMAKKSLKNHIAAGALALQEIERLAKHIAQGLRGNKAIWSRMALVWLFRSSNSQSTRSSPDVVRSPAGVVAMPARAVTPDHTTAVKVKFQPGADTAVLDFEPSLFRKRSIQDGLEQAFELTCDSTHKSFYRSLSWILRPPGMVFPSLVQRHRPALKSPLSKISLLPSLAEHPGFQVGLQVITPAYSWTYPLENYTDPARVTAGR